MAQFLVIVHAHVEVIAPHIQRKVDEVGGAAIVRPVLHHGLEGGKLRVRHIREQMAQVIQLVH